MRYEVTVELAGDDEALAARVYRAVRELVQGELEIDVPVGLVLAGKPGSPDDPRRRERGGDDRG